LTRGSIKFFPLSVISLGAWSQTRLRKVSVISHGASESTVALRSNTSADMDSAAYVPRHLTPDERDDLMAFDTLQVILTHLPPNAPDVWKTQLADLRHFSWLVPAFDSLLFNSLYAFYFLVQ
jgi:hypothetical protein